MRSKWWSDGSLGNWHFSSQANAKACINLTNECTKRTNDWSIFVLVSEEEKTHSKSLFLSLFQKHILNICKLHIRIGFWFAQVNFLSFTLPFCVLCARRIKKNRICVYTKGKTERNGRNNIGRNSLRKGVQNERFEKYRVARCPLLSLSFFLSQ